jgi:hypothetical protein
LVKSASLENGGLLIIVFDEAANDNSHGGGASGLGCDQSQVLQGGHKSTTLYQHQNTPRLLLEGLGLKPYPGSAKNAANMSEFFK